MRTRLVGVASVLVLTVRGPSEHVRDKAYFTAHVQERVQAVGGCSNGSGRSGATPDCVKAIQSDADAEHERVFHGAPAKPPGIARAGHL